MALFVALCFSLHPLRVESVAWVSQRKDVLSLFLGLLSLHGYLFYVDSRRRLPYFISVGLFLLSVLSKPTLVVLPLLMGCLDFWMLNRKREASLFWEKLPFFLVAFIGGVATLMSQSAGGGLRNFSEASVWDRVGMFFQSYLVYFSKLFFPYPLAVIYPFQSFAVAEILVLGGIFFGLLGVWFFKYRHEKALCFALAWFAFATLPVSGLVTVGGQAFADRWTYLSHIGLLWGGLLFVSPRLKGFRWKYGMAFVWLVFLIVITRAYLPVWQNSERLMTHTVNTTENNFVAHNNLGQYYETVDQLSKAEHHFRQSLLIHPGYPTALNNLGVVLARRNQYPEAERLFREVLRRRPTFWRARQNLRLLLSRLAN